MKNQSAKRKKPRAMPRVSRKGVHTVKHKVLKGGAGDAVAAATKELLVGGGGNVFLLNWKRRHWLRWRRDGE